MNTLLKREENLWLFFSWPFPLVWCYVIQKSKGIRALPNKQLQLLNSLKRAQLVGKNANRRLPRHCLFSELSSAQGIQEQGSKSTLTPTPRLHPSSQPPSLGLSLLSVSWLVHFLKKQCNMNFKSKKLMLTNLKITFEKNPLCPS